MPYTFKKKRGYTLKKGESGEMRWHKDPIPTPKPNKKRYSKQGSYKIEPIDLREMNGLQLESNNTRLSRDYSEVSNLVSRSNLIGERPPEMNRFNTFNDGNTFDSMTGHRYELGVGHNLFTGLEDRMFSTHERAKIINAENDMLGKALRMFSDKPDTSLTPHLPTVAQLIDKNEEFTREFLISTLINKNNPNVKLADDLLVDRWVTELLADKAATRITSKSIEAMEYAYDSTKGQVEWHKMGVPRMLAMKVGSKLAYSNLVRDKDKAIRDLQEALKDAGLDLDDNSILRVTNGHRTRKNLTPAKMSTDLYDASRDNFHAKVIDTVVRDKKSMKAFDKLRSILSEEIEATNTATGIAALFVNLAAKNKLDNLKLQDGSAVDDKTVSKLQGKPMNAEVARSDLEAIANHYLKIDSRGRDYPDDFTGGEVDGGMAHLRYSNMFSAHSGGAFVFPVNMNMSIPVSEDVMPGHGGTPLHELTHAYEAVDSLVNTILSGEENGFTLSMDKSLPSPISPALREGVSLDKIRYDRKSARKSDFARKAIIMDIQKAAKFFEDIQLSDATKDIVKEVDTQSPVIQNLAPSVMMLLPEFNRLAYILTSGYNGTRVSGRKGADNKTLGYKLEPKASLSVNAHPEAITIALEYALAAPHVLQAVDEVTGSNIRKNLNEYLGVSIVAESDPVLLANAKINLLALKNAPQDTIYQGYDRLMRNQMKRKASAFVPYQTSFDFSQYDIFGRRD